MKSVWSKPVTNKKIVLRIAENAKWIMAIFPQLTKKQAYDSSKKAVLMNIKSQKKHGW